MVNVKIGRNYNAPSTLLHGSCNINGNLYELKCIECVETILISHDSHFHIK